MDTFRKVQVNIPFLDAIKQVPRYAKFLKELCTNMCNLKGDEKVRVGEKKTTSKVQGSWHLHHSMQNR